MMNQTGSITGNTGAIQKVYVNQDGGAVIKCPKCEAIKSIKVENFKGARHVIKVRCNCQNVFAISLEFRKNYRKDTKLPGDYSGISRAGIRGRMMVVNVSKTGLGFQVMGANPNRVGDELAVKFNLDDIHNSLIEKRVVVRLIKQNFVGCEFLEPSSHDRAIGFYLMV